MGWLAAALVAVLIATVPYDPGESLCGLWGCFPPLPALVSMHALWFVALSASVWTVRRWAPVLLRPLGLALCLAAVAATAVFVSTDLTQWLSRTPAEFHQFWPKRIGYRVFTLTDVPLVQALLVGAICTVRGGRVRS
jgi:hypothetical protein